MDGPGRLRLRQAEGHRRCPPTPLRHRRRRAHDWHLPDTITQGHGRTRGLDLVQRTQGELQGGPLGGFNLKVDWAQDVVDRARTTIGVWDFLEWQEATTLEYRRPACLESSRRRVRGMVASPAVGGSQTPAYRLRVTGRSPPSPTGKTASWSIPRSATTCSPMQRWHRDGFILSGFPIPQRHRTCRDSGPYRRRRGSARSARDCHRALHRQRVERIELGCDQRPGCQQRLEGHVSGLPGNCAVWIASQSCIDYLDQLTVRQGGRHSL